MKKLILIVLLSQGMMAQEIQINRTEYFTVSTSIDPSASIKEGGLDIVGEIEYVGVIYAKAGFESFSVLTGGYLDMHYGIGFNLTSGYFKQYRYYVGFRQAKVNRGGGFRINNGLEAGIDYRISPHWFLGLRTTFDKRYDQEIFSWNPETKLNGFIRIGYRWDYRK